MTWTTVLRVPAWVAGAAVLATGTTALAGDAVSWNFDIATEGEDVLWISPTAVQNDAPRYDVAYEVTLLEVTVRWTIFEFVLDVTDEIPPEFRSGGGIADGPPPITLFQGPLAFPPPPEEPAFAAAVDLFIDADGFGRFSLTDVILGEFLIEIPPFGEQVVQLVRVRTVGRVDVTPLGRAADVNGDGVVDFEDLLIVLASWRACPVEGKCPADIDGNGVVDFGDLLLVLSEWG